MISDHDKKEQTIKEELIIDPLNLQDEWMNQPNLYFKYQKLAARKRQELDKAKEKLEFVKASVAFEIRENPKRHGMQKVTEGRITECTTMSEEVQDCQTLVRQLNYQYTLLLSAVKSFEQRKNALENIVKLTVQGLYADPNCKIGVRSLDDAVNSAQVTDKQKEAAARRSRRRNDKK